MNDANDKALLPAGLSDGLPPEAAFAANVSERLVAAFVARGYDRASPPLVEFEDHLLAGTGAAMGAQTFRLMDPVSQRMMGLRADITPQIARVATTRLAHVPRPLRLCYAGEVLRVRGTQLRPERQFTQAGAELIGTDDPRADAEMVVMAADGLRSLGIQDIKIDLGQPTLVPLAMADAGIEGETANRLRDALDRKDAAEVEDISASLPGGVRDLFTDLMAASGPAEAVADKLAALTLNGEAAAARDALLNVMRLVQTADPELSLTLDAVENRGFEYHSGVTFTVFVPGVRGELGTGGRYMAGQDGSEPATGFTLFLDSVLRAVQPEAPAARVYLAADTHPTTARALRDQGFRTVQGFSDADPAAEAARLGCDYVFDGKDAVAVYKP